MDYRALSALLLFIVFFLVTSGSVTLCTYLKINCSLNESITLEDDGKGYCIEWDGVHVDGDVDDVTKCLLFVKTKRRDGLINFTLNGDSNINGSFNIGFGENVDDEESKLQSVTDSTGWGTDGIIYDSNSIWIEWTVSAVGKIKAQFQDMIFKQFPVTLHKEDIGNFSFPNLSSNYSYRPNSAFIWILSSDVHCESNCNNTNITIQVKEASPSKESGDALIIGMGNKTQLFQGPDSLLLTERVIEPLNIHLSLGEAFVILLTGRSFPKSNVKLEVNWMRNSTPRADTVITTTPMPDAWLQAVAVCIEGQSKEKFSQNKTEFKQKVADRATIYANDKGIVLTSNKIRNEDVEISETYFFESGGNESKEVQIVQIVVTIVEGHDRTKAVFRSERLQEMFNDQHFKEALKNDFVIVDCNKEPNYFDWFLVTCLSFVFSIAVLLIVWYIRYKNSGNDDDDDAKNLLKKNNSQQVVGNEYERTYHTNQAFRNLGKDEASENSDAHSEINTQDNAVTQIKRVEKNHSDVGARRNHVKPNLTRPTSDPIGLQEIKKNRSMDSPKSILRKGVGAVELNDTAIVEESQENVEEHLYDTVGHQKVLVKELDKGKPVDSASVVENQKMLVIKEAGTENPEDGVYAVKIEDEIEDTRC